MKKLLLLITIVAIEFNLNWFFGLPEHYPFKALDERGNEVELVNELKQTETGYEWNVYDQAGNLITFLKF